MTHLIDVHTFIWMISQPDKLSSHARELCEDEENQLVLSMACIWEIQIKVQIRKLNLPKTVKEVVSEQQAVNKIQLLSISLDHIEKLADLPFHHRDPFDRLLIAQSLTEGIPVISSDSLFAPYGVNVIW